MTTKNPKITANLPTLEDLKMNTKNPKITNEHHDYTYSPCANWEYDGAQGTMRYAMGHWCLHYEAAAQWVENGRETKAGKSNGALSAVQRAIDSGEMGRLLKVVRGILWVDSTHGRKEAVINGRVIARVMKSSADAPSFAVELYWNQLNGPRTRNACNLRAAERLVYDHAAQPGVADPYAYLDGLEDATA